MNSVDAFVDALDSRRIRALLATRELPDRYRRDLATHVAPLAAALAARSRCASGGLLIGINGCQGSGKSTLAQFLAQLLDIGASLRCAVVSLDDFYLQKSARRRLARDVHPLLVTRGVPGTHDLVLAGETLAALLDRNRSVAVRVPVFDKARDERCEPEKWRSIDAGVDLVIFEGWCVGCPAQDPAALPAPVNALEHKEDAAGLWRTFVNDRLANEYAALFLRLDQLVMLRAPRFRCVLDWRDKQERQSERRGRHLADSHENAAYLGGASLERFVRHFERLTRHQLAVLPALADAVIDIGDDHGMLAHRGRLFTD